MNKDWRVAIVARKRRKKSLKVQEYIKYTLDNVQISHADPLTWLAPMLTPSQRDSSAAFTASVTPPPLVRKHTG